MQGSLACDRLGVGGEGTPHQHWLTQVRGMIPDYERLGKLLTFIPAQFDDDRDDRIAINRPHGRRVVEHLVDVGAAAAEYVRQSTIGQPLFT